MTTRAVLLDSNVLSEDAPGLLLQAGFFSDYTTIVSRKPQVAKHPAPDKKWCRR
ncbi:MAG: hypothetical protein MPL62_07530 [Alphaproteobacteria bacterium]|nr:hypothetical protein [Alphaproteobacteria bacterium]